VSRRKNRKIDITRKGTGRFCYAKLSTLSNGQKKYWGTPIWRHLYYLHAFDPICSWAPDGSAPYFFRSFDRVADTLCFTYQKIKKNRPLRAMPLRAMPLRAMQHSLCPFENTPPIV